MVTSWGLTAKSQFDWEPCTNGKLNDESMHPQSIMRAAGGGMSDSFVDIRANMQDNALVPFF